MCQDAVVVCGYIVQELNQLESDLPLLGIDRARLFGIFSDPSRQRLNSIVEEQELALGLEVLGLDES